MPRLKEIFKNLKQLEIFTMINIYLHLMNHEECGQIIELIPSSSVPKNQLILEALVS